MKRDKTISSKRRTQRRNAAQGDLHELRKKLGAPLSKELRKSLKKRAALVTKDSRVKILNGGFKGVSGKVLSCDSIRGTIAVEGIVAKKQNGREEPIAIRASNVVIIEQAVREGKAPARPAVSKAPAKAAAQEKK